MQKWVMSKLFLPEVITRGSFCTWTSIFTIPSRLCQSVTTEAAHYQIKAQTKWRLGGGWGGTMFAYKQEGLKIKCNATKQMYKRPALIKRQGSLHSPSHFRSERPKPNLKMQE